MWGRGVLSSVHGIPVWGMFYIKWCLAKSISFPVCPFLRNAMSSPSQPSPLLVHCTSPGWAEARGAWGGKLACGEPWGTPGLRCLADEVTSSPSQLLRRLED